MIITDRFPTTYSDTNYPLFEYERTDSIVSLGDGFKNYWLGYMLYDNIPSALLASEFSSTDDSATAKPVNTPTNSPVGYTTDSYGYGTLISTILKEVDFSVGNNYVTYLNSFHVPSSAVQIDFSTGGTTGCQLWVSVETGTTTEYGTHLQRDLTTLSDDDRTTSGLIEFLLGNRDITLTHTINSVSVTHTLKAQDLEDNGIAIFKGVANGLYYKMSVFIAGYGFKPYPGKDSSLANLRTYHINPCLKMYTDYGNYYAIKSNCIFAGTNTRYSLTTHTFYALQSWGAYISGIGALGGWDFEFSNDDLADLLSYEILYNGNTVAYKLSDIVEMWRVYKPADLIHHFALLMRIPSSVSYGYHADIYCPEVLDNGEFTGNLLTGELTEEDVQPWQWGNIIVDGFKEENIPEYVPSDDGEDSGGDTIAPYDFTNTPLSAANNFTTLYALTTAQVAEFGAIMWAKLADPNFWHAVGVEFSNDFSINPADMMRYFNFLRYYPFDLTPYSSQYISGIYIGRSTIPLEFPAGTEYPRRATRNLIQIDGGKVTAQLPAQYNTSDFFISDPATQIQAHIPFCGSVQLSAAECYGRELYLKYVVDLQSGAIQATISVQSDAYYIVATLAGTCGAGVQITANNNIEFLTRIATVATGGISSAATMAARGAQVAGAEGAAAAGVVGALTGTVSALAGLPPVTVHKQGNTTGFANYGGDPQAYITIQTPKRSTPDTYPQTFGYLSNKKSRIGDLSGYTEMINPDLSGISAHQDELEEIRQLLETGFYA